MKADKHLLGKLQQALDLSRHLNLDPELRFPPVGVTTFFRTFNILSLKTIRWDVFINVMSVLFTLKCVYVCHCCAVHVWFCSVVNSSFVLLSLRYSAFLHKA